MTEITAKKGLTDNMKNCLKKYGVELSKDKKKVEFDNLDFKVGDGFLEIKKGNKITYLDKNQENLDLYSEEISKYRKFMNSEHININIQKKDISISIIKKFSFTFVSSIAAVAITSNLLVLMAVPLLGSIAIRNDIKEYRKMSNLSLIIKRIIAASKIVNGESKNEIKSFSFSEKEVKKRKLPILYSRTVKEMDYYHFIFNEETKNSNKVYCLTRKKY